MMKKIKIFFSLSFLILTPLLISAGSGTVYLVIGSDTAIWDGMSTGRYHCTYNPELYTSPTDNGYGVMNIDFRNELKDSFGTPMKLTWWMMAGNIFRYATNTNIPLPNIMTLYLMKQYHSSVISEVGDELSLHYHTFKWTDYNKDGLWYWNQAERFEECRNDFDVTLCQFLLEEEIFPVSFRSGWHYMDNDWQAYLDEILPYSMHNAYPAHGIDETEPLDNNYNWSEAPAEFVPYHPSQENYQIPGTSSGWNVRSAHFNQTRYQDLMDTIFTAASEGIDQVACLWGHLPENDFKSNLVIMDSLAHKMVTIYPEVKFRYCTAIEAMQRWQNSTDSIAPTVEINEIITGENVCFTITCDDDIFQSQPYVAVKDIYQEYKKIACNLTGSNTWETTESVNIDELAKIGVAVCDSFGNQTIEIKKYLPDDQYIDNSDENFSIESGSWSDYTINARQTWGVNSVIAELEENESAAANWTPEIIANERYNIFYRVPPFSNPVDDFVFLIIRGVATDTIFCRSPIEFDEWNYVTTTELNPDEQNCIRIQASGPGQIVADAIRVTPLVKDYEIQSEYRILNLSGVSVDDTVGISLKLLNRGIKDLIISQISSKFGYIFYEQDYPVTIPAMDSRTLGLKFFSNTIEEVIDTLSIFSNDPKTPQLKIPVIANVQNYFEIVDNSDSANYQEFGEWHTSVAEAYGVSSRYAWLNSGQSTYALYRIELSHSGIYDILEIVPQTVNAANHAVYFFSIADVPIDSFVVDQNQGSGSWVKICRQFIPADVEVEIKVLDDGNSTEGDVLRADAIKFDLIQSLSDVEEVAASPAQYRLEQNFPNPFNSSTNIEYYISRPEDVNLVIYNSLGQKIAELVNEFQQSGQHKISWNSGHYSSGLYLYQLKTNNFTKTRKMLIIK